MIKHNGAFWYLTENERNCFPHESRNKTWICDSNVVMESQRREQRNLMNPQRFFRGSHSRKIKGLQEKQKKNHTNQQINKKSRSRDSMRWQRLKQRLQTKAKPHIITTWWINLIVLLPPGIFTLMKGCKNRLTTALSVCILRSLRSLTCQTLIKVNQEPYREENIWCRGER